MASPEELDFASKLLDAEKLIGRKINNSYKWNFGLTALLIALLCDFVKYNDEISIEWLNLTASHDFIILILSFSLLLSQLSGIVWHFEGGKISSRVQQLYREINLGSTLINDNDYKYILYPDTIGSTLSEEFFFSNFLGKTYYFLSHIIVGLGLQVAPIVAQVFVLNYLFTLYPYNVWLIIIAVIHIFFQITVIASVYMQIFEENRHEDELTKVNGYQPPKSN